MTERLSASVLLEVWERGLTATPLTRSLALLGVAYPDQSPDDLGRLPIFVRDAELLKLRRRLFGSVLEALCDCPHCREAVEMTLDIEQLALHDLPLENQHFLWEQDGFVVRFRLPASADILAVAAEPDPASAARRLFECCVLETRCGKDRLEATQLPETLARSLADRMAQIDAQAAVTLEMTCPACGHAWISPFDIASFLWSEWSARAERLLVEVHILASAYGWSEEAILALSPARRKAYLSKISG